MYACMQPYAHTFLEVGGAIHVRNSEGTEVGRVDLPLSIAASLNPRPLAPAHRLPPLDRHDNAGASVVVLAILPALLLEPIRSLRPG